MARPNILLIHCHDLGQHLGCYGIETVRTPHLDELFSSEAAKRGTSAQEVEAGFVSDTPIRRILEPEEIARAVLFLASAHGAAITGDSIAIDGGITRGVYL